MILDKILYLASNNLDENRKRLCKIQMLVNKNIANKNVIKIICNEKL